MINSVNKVEFNAMNHGSSLLQSGIVPLDRCKIAHNSKIPQNSNERFTSTYAVQTSLSSYTADNNELSTDIQSSKTKEIHMQPQRVQVQHLQIHPNLQNNRWSYNTFYNLSNDVERTQQDDSAIGTNNNNNLIRKESAFSLNSKNKNKNNNHNNNNNNNNNNNISNNNTSCSNIFSQIEGGKNISGNISHKPIKDVEPHSGLSDRRSSSVYNTDYQENAFLRIKDVHNYAKLDNHYSYSNESSNSSIHDEENEDDDDGLDEDLDDNNDDAATNYERFLKNNTPYGVRKYKCNKETAKQNINNMRVIRMETEETENNVDVETVHKVQNESEERISSTPEHHARRPMNAFLIFCKRHRAIVKERYKSLENRAITKILGDWWASLDNNDKKYFTNLAQQNKDAFFNANPNFKWYKLPAPPLRTLNTRPGNSERVGDQEDAIKTVIIAQSNGNMIPKFTNYKTNQFFKLADEAQMGELSTLITNEGNNNIGCINQNALQKALGETSKFLNAYMPHTNNTDCRKLSKIRLLNENSFSSNGSEDDNLQKKSSRACKGKIYQELVNSGQISAASKKLKIPKAQNYHNSFTQQSKNSVHRFQQVLCEGSNKYTALAMYKDNVKQCEAYPSDISESNNDILNFDLEEKIKELPALSLDIYLQRKRNTNKKKKFTSKKRHSNSASNNKYSGAVNIIHKPIETASKKIRETPARHPVGSQKRKARKESITRRDVTAIDNEIASVIPLAKSFGTINGSYYFDESPDLTMSKTPLIGQIIDYKFTTTVNNKLANDFVNLNNDNISSTSDLLILAEVAANRTELTH